MSENIYDCVLKHKCDKVMIGTNAELKEAMLKLAAARGKKVQAAILSSEPCVQFADRLKKIRIDNFTNIENVEEFIKECGWDDRIADPNTTIDGFPVLWQAIRKLNEFVIKAFIKNKQDISSLMEYKGDDKYYPLSPINAACVNKKRSNCAVILLEAGASAELPDEVGFSPLMQAICNKLDNNIILGIARTTNPFCKLTKKRKCNNVSYPKDTTVYDIMRLTQYPDDETSAKVINILVDRSNKYESCV